MRRAKGFTAGEGSGEGPGAAAILGSLSLTGASKYGKLLRVDTYSHARTGSYNGGMACPI
jgi:hypothetical protein